MIMKIKCVLINKKRRRCAKMRWWRRSETVINVTCKWNKSNKIQLLKIKK